VYIVYSHILNPIGVDRNCSNVSNDGRNEDRLGRVGSDCTPDALSVVRSKQTIAAGPHKLNDGDVGEGPCGSSSNCVRVQSGPDDAGIAKGSGAQEVGTESDQRRWSPKGDGGASAKL
jgi:hypothetical protein